MSAALPVVEPYLQWDADGANGTGQAIKAPPPQPLLFELAPGFDWKTDSLLRNVCQHAHPAAARFVTGIASDPAHLHALKGPAYAGKILRIASGRTRYAPLSTPDVAGHEEMTLAGLGGKAVVAVIDDGIAFAHERFRALKQAKWYSRIAFLWDQSSGAAGGRYWRAVSGFKYGRELSARKIAKLFNDGSSGGVIDEDEVYRRATFNSVAAPLTHGTHVLDLAAGADPRGGAAAQAPAIVAVQLPSAASRDTSGGWMALNIVDALRYIDKRVAQDAKLVINLSYGAMAGPHDGSTMIERVIEQMHRDRSKNFALVLPAGNGFRSRTHARVRLAPGQSDRLRIDVRSDDPTETFAEFWHSAVADLTLTVDTPDGRTLGPIAAGGSKPLPGTGGGIAAALYRDASHEGQHRTVLCLQPCLRLDAKGATAPPGRWTVNLAAAATGVPALVDAWIERDEPILGTTYPSRRQAVFADDGSLPDACRDGGAIDRTLTMNHIAHAPSAIVVGAARNRSQPQVCDYSACGGTTPHGVTREPDVVALGDESATQPGIAAAGTRSGITGRLSGTSVAAPQVARRIAAWFAASGPPLSVADIRAALRAVARPVDDPCSATAGTGRHGAGFID